MNPDNMIQTYLDFVEERHRIWERRQRGEPGPWSEDPVLRGTKFTNVFRVLDPGSQFLLKMLDEPGLSERDALARAILYRYTNHPRVWERTRTLLNRYPEHDDMDEGLADLWCRLRDQERLQVFSGAYIIMPRPGVKGADKVRDAVDLAWRTTETVWWDFFQATTVEERYRILVSQPSVGKFMAMQITTDIGYSRHGQHDENEFVVAGPGARLGTAYLKMMARPESVILSAQRWIPDTIPDVHLVLPNGEKRYPSLMDVQNTFCEFGKYVRRWEKGQGRGRVYQPEHPGEQVPPVFPAHWI